MTDHLSIASFDEFPLAEGLAARLSKEGFHATAESDAEEQFWRLYNLHPRAHCHVCVPMAHVEAALAKLAELDVTEGVLEGAVRCPDCGSSRIEFPQFSRNTIMGALPALAATAGFVDRRFYCCACHFTWAPGTDPVDTVPAGKDLLK